MHYWNRHRSQFVAQAIKMIWLLNTRTPEGLKRCLDVIVSGLALVALFPVFAVIYLWIKLEDGGPALFWQLRIGKHGREFAFPKFRSMIVNAEARLAQIREQNQHGDTITFKMKEDPRITRVGKVLRRLSLDEAPQLWCVLKGDMSLVGPRPALPGEVAKYSLEARRRLDVTPGLTCIWQVSGRSNLAFPIQCKLDVDYIEQQSLALDLKLIAKTVPAVLTGKGAY
jgi:lipopolysaccharide/colanic/teichoic acid biosynthesis glycosyltransferase